MPTEPQRPYWLLIVGALCIIAAAILAILQHS